MGLKKPLRKVVYALILIAVFLVSYGASLLVISVIPCGHYSARQYSNPQTSINYGSPSTMGGAWQEQLLLVFPAGASNVPRDTSIVIVAPRPVRVFNVTFNPTVAIAEDKFVEYDGFGPSSVQTVYPASLLQLNTTYNVTATVAGTLSWFVFTTSSNPSQVAFAHPLASYDLWVAIIGAILVTLTVSLLMSRSRRSMPHTVLNVSSTT